jgi:threonine/homoserine/homoserine lactone efflux protein
MTLGTFLAFLAASGILLLIPGPTVLLVVSYALGQGLRTALPIALGVALGEFTLLKWLGAAYLIWLGVKLWRAGGRLDAAPKCDATPPLRMLLHAFMVTALNPKSLTFFIAFLPQFLDRNADFLTQMLILEASFLVLALGNVVAYALVASRARALMRNRRAVTFANRLGGSLLIGAGVAAVSLRATQN